MHKLRLQIFVLAVVVFSAAFAFAQDMMLPTTAGVQNEALIIVPGEGTPLTVDDAPGGLAGLVWSADGARLANITRAGELRITDGAGSDPRTLATGVSYLPPTFSPDGATVYYAVEGETTASDAEGRPTASMTVMAVSADGGQPTTIADFAFRVGCGGGSPYPMDALYSTGAGFMGNALTFTVTPFGLLHSLDCSGTGLGMLDLSTGEDTVLIAEGFGRAALSPDGSQVAGVTYNENLQAIGIQLVDLATGAVSDVVTGIDGLDQIAWGDDGSIYYSTRVQMGALPLQLSGGERAEFERFYGSADQIPAYTVGLYRVDPNEVTTELLSGSGWALINLFVEGDWLYFNQIPSAEAWVYGVARGEIDPTTEAGAAAERSAAAPLLLRVPVAGGEAEVIGGGLLLASPQP